ncbi:hypothetical protein L484_025868 [Morus notabilis]|uniref:Uncharacterized protein n=1 Tax=Morus notabilis TaxID=981085 RepID=W9R2Q9_9ROSA|nr:hypothetical protein L484_025868 [Morus notabilis]
MAGRRCNLRLHKQKPQKVRERKNEKALPKNLQNQGTSEPTVALPAKSSSPPMRAASSPRGALVPRNDSFGPLTKKPP